MKQQKKKKLRYYVFCLAFLCLLIVPPAVWYAFPGLFDMENHENRTLAEFPDLGHTGVWELPGKLDTYYTDHLPLKNELAMLSSCIDIRLFHMLDSDAVLLGKNNWMFYKGEESIEDYQGTSSYTEEEQEQLLQAIDGMDRYLKSLGIRVAYVVIPNKERVNREYMPDEYPVLNENNRLEQMLVRIREETDAEVLYLMEPLKEAKKLYPTHYRYDTHWNNIGAFVGTQEILKWMGREDTALDEVKVTSKVGRNGDLAGLLNLQPVIHDDVVYSFPEYRTDVTVEKTLIKEHTVLDCERIDSSVDDGSSLFFVGDSFGVSLEPLLCVNVDKSTFAHRESYEQGMIEEAQPDAVIIEVVERYFRELIDCAEAMLP